MVASGVHRGPRHSSGRLGRSCCQRKTDRGVNMVCTPFLLPQAHTSQPQTSRLWPRGLGEPGGPSWREESCRKNREGSQVTQGEPPRHHPATALSPSLPAELQCTVRDIVPSPLSPKPRGQDVPTRPASTRAASCVTQPRQLPEVPISAACHSGQAKQCPEPHSVSAALLVPTNHQCAERDTERKN